MRIIERLLSALAWFQVFISPVIIGAFLGVISWLVLRNLWGIGLGVALGVLGCIIGIAFAEKARRSNGTIEFMSRNIAHPELREKELSNGSNRIK